MADLLITPRLTEKSYALATEGIFTFNVPLEANKYHVKRLVEEQYQVTVKNISMVRSDGKQKSFSRGKNRYPGKRYQPDSKKAFVRLAEGDKIAIFEPEVKKDEEKGDK